MSYRKRRLVAWSAILVVCLGVGLCAVGQQQKVAVFVQAAAPVPAADLELLRNYATQRCSVITGARTCNQGELMLAQRITGTYIGNSITVQGLQQLAQTLEAEHVVILRLVRWESQISYKPERSLLLLGATTFLDSSLQLLITPLGLLFGIDKEATVALFASVFDSRGNLEFTTAVTCADRPLLSLLTADPLEAAKGAVDTAFYQLAVAL